MTATKRYGIHWFRRDLRITGNPALQWNLKNHEGAVVGVFCFDAKFLARPDFSHGRFQFFMNTLVALRDELRGNGGGLLFLDVGPDEAFAKLFSKLKSGPGLPVCVSWNRDYEPFARSRDDWMAHWFQEAGVETHTERDHVLIEPQEIFKGSDPKDGYSVYTPYSKKWLEHFKSPQVQDRVKAATKTSKGAFTLKWKSLLSENTSDALLETYLKKNGAKVSYKLPAAGSAAALDAVKVFKSKLGKYQTARDFPAVSGTSHFSIYFKNGSLTVAQVISHLDLGGAMGMKFLLELVWREFYYYILARNPNVEKEAFQRRYIDIKWENNEKWFDAWKEGKTGFPIVDAGMRQLKETGWMHNRVRMIVASFLSKDLLINWQWGERHFMELLLDGDLAPNNGGWQWAASTGCDAQPYFRVFNPYLQSKKFDTNGEYIRKYLPELRDLSNQEIHEPTGTVKGYPAPIVDHSTQREKAIALFKIN